MKVWEWVYLVKKYNLRFNIFTGLMQEIRSKSFFLKVHQNKLFFPNGLTRRFLKFIFFVCPLHRLELLLDMIDRDEFWMQKAIEEAKKAGDLDEVPVGACVIGANGEILATAGNRTITRSDPTAHAEILVLRQAAEKISNYRLTEMVLYTTIEPCAMCAGALVNARIKRLVFGAHDKRFGAVESVFRLCDSSSLNHKMEITSGVLAVECKKLMQDFFKLKRSGG